jgi:hypothetical protein
MGELKPPGKPFDISKWEAYQKVKGNKGGNWKPATSSRRTPGTCARVSRRVDWDL